MMMMVQQNSVDINRQENIDQEQSTEPQMEHVKPNVKKSKFTPLNIGVSILVLALLAFGSYKIYTTIAVVPQKNQISLAHKQNIITNSDTGSQTGKSDSGNSQASKSSKGGDKPQPGSNPAGKSIIGGVPQGSTGSGSGDEEDDPNDNGENRKKKLNKDKLSNTGSSKNDQTTEEEESVSDESEELINLAWPNNIAPPEGSLVGNIRKMI